MTGRVEALGLTDAFCHDWEQGTPLSEMAKMYGYRTTISVIHVAARLDLGPRPEDEAAPHVLHGGSWVGRNGICVWVPRQDTPVGSLTERFREAFYIELELKPHRPPGPAALSRRLGWKTRDFPSKLCALRTRLLEENGFVRNPVTKRWERVEERAS